MKITMFLFVAMCACANAGVIAPIVPGPTLVRTPAHDSAIIKSDRLGGNFAYSTAEAHAYAQITPIVQNVVSPVGVSYQTHAVPTVAVGYAQAPLVAHAPIALGVAHAPLPISSPIGIAHPGLAVVGQDPTLSSVGIESLEGAVPIPAPAPVSIQVAADDDSVAIDSV